MRTLAAISNQGLGFGLLISAFAFGFRHGIDWDHIAAITDIASSQSSPRRALTFGTLYAAGHSVVVFVIGIVAIIAGRSLPDSVDETMGKVVGVTLLLLGVYVFYALIKYRRDFRMRSRWMLMFSGLRRAYVWLRERVRRAESEEVLHEHEHATAEAFVHHDVHEEASNGTPSSAPVAVKARTHAHEHRHRAPSDPFMNYGRATSTVVGMLHGVGAETPTQVTIFLAAAGAGGVGLGILILGVFLVGLFVANSAIVLASAYGYLGAGRSFALYVGVSVTTGVVSLVIGTIFVLGKETFLPALFGG
jgi:high-affinity nickel-transport protein